MRNGSYSKDFLGFSSCTTKSALFSNSLRAPRINVSGHGSGLILAPNSMRKVWLTGRGLGLILRWHRSSSELLENCIPQGQMPIFGRPSQVIDAHARFHRVRIVAADAVLL